MLVEQQYGFDPRAGEIVGTFPPRRSGLGFAAAGGAVTGAAVGGGIAASIATVGILAAPMALQMWLNRKGPGQKRTTSLIADERERLLQDNLDLYLAGAIDQATALGNFEVLWGDLVAQCSQISMGEPGQRCVNERKRGGVWDWFKRYRDPISDTPQPTAVGADGRAVEIGSGASYLPFAPAGVSMSTLVVAGLAVGAAMLL
jgi:hypothetical protein